MSRKLLRTAEELDIVAEKDPSDKTRSAALHGWTTFVAETKAKFLPLKSDDASPLALTPEMDEYRTALLRTAQLQTALGM